MTDDTANLPAREASSAPGETEWSLALARLVIAEVEDDAEFRRCWDEVAGMFRSLTATVAALTAERMELQRQLKDQG